MYPDSEGTQFVFDLASQFSLSLEMAANKKMVCTTFEQCAVNPKIILRLTLICSALTLVTSHAIPMTLTVLTIQHLLTSMDVG